ncbi:MAG: phosphatidylserine decarboxylase family protein [Rhodothermales bacterium]|nr:phosphatidylserine decarboxylase family protein [Rhodothermales bacterium]MBO6780215.1 phosphatidylserine decarboxylase family protein [Rhodothermales bacterium]
MFAREGYALIAASAVIGAALVLLSFQVGQPIAAVVGTLGVLVFAFTLWFFRDPSRTPPDDVEELLLAPADGKVVEIVQEEDRLYLKGSVKRISIFLSPLNVHVNRSPATGVIEFDEYVPGEYLVAWHPKASEKNERSQLGLMHASGTKVLFKQIAGAVARRIVYHVGVGDSLKAGERFGIVKFGSRMDVIVPPHIPVFAEVGDRVVAGETILGHLIPQGAEATTNAEAAEAR